MHINYMGYFTRFYLCPIDGLIYYIATRIYVLSTKNLLYVILNVFRFSIPLNSSGKLFHLTAASMCMLLLYNRN